MKGACQEKTSPLPAIKSYFFDRQPSTYPQTTPGVAEWLNCSLMLRWLVA
jgi:hypothetical protein